MTVRYQACPQLIGSELLPNVVVMAGKLGVRAVAQVCRQLRARGNGLPDTVSTGARMSDGDNHTRGGRLLDKWQRALSLRRKRENLDPAACRLLKLAELLPIGILGVLDRVGATRAVFR